MNKNRVLLVRVTIVFTIVLVIGFVSEILAEGVVSEKDAGPLGRIAFVSVRSGNWDLWTIEADGTDQIQLTQTPLDERSPAWSPESDRIAYATNDGKLWILELGGKPEEIPLKGDDSGSKLAINSHPHWFPDGKSIVFTSYGDPKLDDSDIWKVNVNGEALERFILQKDLQLDPSWSPDGKLLIYSSAAYGPFYDIMQDLWIMEFYGRKARRLLVNDAANMQPEWSPDGTKIAFASDKTGDMEIWLMDSHGKNLKQLTHDKAYDADPAWSPDGKYLAFVSNRSGSTQVWLMHNDGSNPRQLTQEGQSKDPSWGNSKGE